jgi:hypothetical protein
LSIVGGAAEWPTAECDGRRSGRDGRSGVVVGGGVEGGGVVGCGVVGGGG